MKHAIHGVVCANHTQVSASVTQHVSYCGADCND